MTTTTEHDAVVPTDHSLGDLLKQYRQTHPEVGTQKQLADVLGVSERALGNYENGRTVPRAAVLRALQRVLGVRLIPLGGGRYRTAPFEETVPNLAGVDVVEATTGDGRFSISFPKGELDKLPPLERELRIARATVAALEAILESGRPEGDESHTE